jgi:hypothetical protein
VIAVPPYARTIGPHMRNLIAHFIQNTATARKFVAWDARENFAMPGLLGGSRWQSIFFAIKNQAFCTFHRIFRLEAVLKGQFVPVQSITGLQPRELALQKRDSDRSDADTGSGETRTLNPIEYVGHNYGWGHA